MKNTSLLVKLAFPIGLVGTITRSYFLKESHDITYDDIGIWPGLLIGSVSALCLIGFFVIIHFGYFAIPDDLFTGPMFGKTGPLFESNPAIFRQGVVFSFCLFGSGLGYVFSSPVFDVSTLGLGLSLLIPGVAGSILLVGLWKRSHKN